MKIMIATSIGEVIDKLSILIIKSKKIVDLDKLSYVLKELEEIRFAVKKIEDEEFNIFLKKLIKINEKMWKVNDKRKLLISNQEFTDEYLELTKSESLLNDQRFKIKNEINNLYNSEIKEQKSYI